MGLPMGLRDTSYLPKLNSPNPSIPTPYWLSPWQLQIEEVLEEAQFLTRSLSPYQLKGTGQLSPSGVKSPSRERKTWSSDPDHVLHQSCPHPLTPKPLHSHPIFFSLPSPPLGLYLKYQLLIHQYYWCSSFWLGVSSIQPIHLCPWGTSYCNHNNVYTHIIVFFFIYLLIALIRSRPACWWAETSYCPGEYHNHPQVPD